MAQHAKWLIEQGEARGLPVVRVKNKFAMDDSSEYDGCVPALSPMPTLRAIPCGSAQCKVVAG